MNKIVSKYLMNTVLLSIFILVLTPLIQAAESTADVSADAELKEKLRQKIMGQTGGQLVDEEYIIGYRDILHVSVYGEGSMSASGGIQSEATNNVTGTASTGGDFLRGRGTGIEVRLDGRISVRHIGDVSVVGMTLTQLADYLKQLYTTIYDEPSLTVTLVQSNSLQYTVMGQVTTPGLFHLDFPLTVIRAVARAGGFTEWANSDITIIRQNVKETNVSKTKKEKKGITFKFDFDDFLKGKDLQKNILIKSGDVIVVH